MLVGHCVFGSPDAALLVSLLPQLVHVRGEQRLATLVQLVGEESRERRPARDVILARLLEVLLIEALRSTAGTAASPGLLRGLADERLAVAIRAMHESPTAALDGGAAGEGGRPLALGVLRAIQPRSGRGADGVPAGLAHGAGQEPAAAQRRRRRRSCQRVGYGSASAFSVAFTRYVGLPPMRYAREQTAAQAALQD